MAYGNCETGRRSRTASTAECTGRQFADNIVSFLSTFGAPSACLPFLLVCKSLCRT